MFHLSPLGAPSPQREQYNIRIFISSTFTDFEVERNAILSRCVPKLKREARSLGIDFSISSLRWGVSKNAFETHSTLDVCLKEVANIILESSGVCFMGMLGNKYGWVPPPSLISPEFYAILLEYTDDTTRQSLRRWYKQDKNHQKQCYVTLPFSRERQAHEWSIDGTRILQSIRIIYKSSDFPSLSSDVQEEIRYALMSVTEREFRHAAKLDDSFNQRSLLILRDVPQLDSADVLKDAAVSKFIDITLPPSSQDSSNPTAQSSILPQQNDWAKQKLSNLKAEMKELITKVEHHQLPWEPSVGIDPLTNAQHAAYIDTICGTFEDFARTSINNLASSMDMTTLDLTSKALLRDLRFQQNIVRARAEVHIGRSDLLENLIQHIFNSLQPSHQCNPEPCKTSTSEATTPLELLNVSTQNAGDTCSQKANKPLFLRGSSGVGKTSLMARTTQLVWERFACFEDASTQDDIRHNSNISKVYREHILSPMETTRPTILLYRLIGTSPQTTSLRLLVRSLTEQLQILTCPSKDSHGNLIPANTTKMPALDHGDNTDTDQTVCDNKFSGATASLAASLSSFHRALTHAALHHRIIILLDSLDQLSSLDATSTAITKLFPNPLPSNVAVIASVLDKTPIYQALEQTSSFASCFCEVPSIDASLSERIVMSYLHREGRKLTSMQREIIVEACRVYQSPMYAHLAAVLASKWPSFADSTLITLKHSTESLVEQIFQKLEVAFGTKLVSSALAYISIARRGLSVDEIEHVLSCDDVVLNAVFENWTPPVRRLPPLLWSRIYRELVNVMVHRSTAGGDVLTWYHSVFVRAAERRYLHDKNQRQYYHSQLADYFLGTWAETPKSFLDPLTNTECEELRFVPKQPLLFLNHDSKPSIPNFRKLDELPYHLAQAGRHSELVSFCVGSFEWLQIKSQAFDIYELLNDIQLAEKVLQQPVATHVTTLKETLLLSAHVLEKHPTELSSQILARFTADALCNAPLLQEIAVSAWTSKDNIVRPAVPCLTMPGGPLMRSLTGHAQRVTCVLFLRHNSTKLITASSDRTIKLWNISDGTVLQTFEGFHQTVSDVAMNESETIIAGAGGCVKLFRIETGELVTEVDLEGSYATRVSFGRLDENIICLARNGIHIYNLSSDALDMRLRVKPVTMAPAFHIDGCRCMAFNQQLNELLAGYSDNTARIWSLDAGVPTHTLDHGSVVEACTYTNDFNIIITVAHDRFIRLWQRLELLPVCILTVSTPLQAPVSSITPLPGGELYFVITTCDVNVQIFYLAKDLSEFIEAARFHAHSDWINSASVSLDCNILVTAGDDKVVHLWKLRRILHQYRANNSIHDTDHLQKEKSPTTSSPLTIQTYIDLLQYHEREIVDICCHPNLPLFFTASRDKTVATWEIFTEVRSTNCEPPHSPQVSPSNADSPLTASLPQLGNEEDKQLSDTTACCRRLLTPCVRALPELTAFSEELSKFINVVQLNSLCNDGGDWVNCVAVMNTIPVVVYGTENKSLRFHRWTKFSEYNRSAPESLKVIDRNSIYPKVETVPCPQPIVSIVPSKDDQHLFVADKSGNLHLYAVSGLYIMQFKHLEYKVKLLRHCEDILIATCDDHTVALLHWESSTRTLRPLQQFKGHSSNITDVCFLGSSHIASVSLDHTCRIWECTCDENHVIIRNPSAGIMAVASSIDGDLLATADYDGVIVVRSFPECQKLSQFHADTQVLSLTFLRFPIPAFIYGTYGGRCGILEVLANSSCQTTSSIPDTKLNSVLYPLSKEEYQREQSEKAQQLCGWFFKQGEYIRSRKRRFFTRKSRVLEYYKSIDGKPCIYKGFIDLDRATCIENQGSILLIHTPTRIWSLLEESEGMARDWAARLQVYVNVNATP